MDWSNIFTVAGAIIGMITALITTVGAVAAYKLQKSQKPSVAGGAVKLLSLKEQRSLSGGVLLLRIVGCFTIIVAPLWAGFVIWSFDLETAWIVIIILGVTIIVALYVYILVKLRGDLSKRRSRTKHETTISVRAPYDIVFSKCNDAILRLKARIVLLDFEKGMIESERTQAWHVQFILNVQITRLDPDRCSIYIESDVTPPTILFDFGMNARRVSRFVNELTQ